MYTDKKRKKHPLALVVILIAAVLTGIFLLNGESDGEKVDYRTFYEWVQEGEIEEAVLGEEVRFKKTGEEAWYRTDHPGTDSFKEMLLLEGVSVQEETDYEELLYTVLDLLFDAVFFGIIGFAAYKGIGTYRKTFKVVKQTGITFDHIAGMKREKKELSQAVEVLKDPRLYRERGIRPLKGILLEGPPGNGKTLFARALAQEADVRFIAAKGADFQSALMSIGPMKIRMLFQKARRNKPCILFIDEFDSIGERRSYAGSGIDKENNRIITTMLNEMDGFEAGSGVLVVAATNSAKALDPALIRPGRFDIKYHIGLPDAETRRELIGLYTRGKQLDPKLNADFLAERLEGVSCAGIETLFNEAAMLCLEEGVETIGREQILEAAERIHIRIDLRK